MTTFDYSQPDQRMPIGSVVQSPINLEAITNGAWVRLDGRDCYRSDYPMVQKYFPAGTFTSTAQTLNSAPYSPCIISDGTYFIASAAANATSINIQYSSDGVTWNNKAVATALTSSSWASACMIYTGSAYITVGVGDGSNTCSYSAATLTGTWFQGSGPASSIANAGTNLAQALAYSPTLSRVVGIRNGALTIGANGINYTASNAATWLACTGSSTSLSRKAVCWTGNRFIVVTTGQVIQTSSDGITWADEYLPTSASPVSAASDGAGTVVIYGTFPTGSASQYGFLVSKNHGVTWSAITLYELSAYEAGAFSQISYANGKFFLGAGTFSSPNYISSDGLSWSVDPILARGGNSSGVIAAIAYKSGTYCGCYTSTAAYTATEDMSKFSLPKLFPGSFSNAGQISLMGSVPAFMRVK